MLPSFIKAESPHLAAMLALRIKLYGTFTSALQTIECYVNVKDVVNGDAQSLETAGLLPQRSRIYAKSLSLDIIPLSPACLSLVSFPKWSYVFSS